MYARVARASQDRSSASQGDSLLNEAVNLQSQLLGSSVPPLDPSLNDLRHKFSQIVENIFITNIEVAARNNLDQALWKIVFYFRIDALRKDMRVSAMDVQTAGEDKLRASRGRERLRAARGALFQVLTEARQFYDTFITKLQANYHLSLEQQIPSNVWDKDADVNIKAAYIACEKCYVLRGDIERYAEQHGSTPDKNWELSRSFYNQARRIRPTDGNPHNQLAVIATNDGPNIGDALFHYYGALCCTLPFVTAAGNVAMLFEKAKKVCDGWNEEIDDAFKQLADGQPVLKAREGQSSVGVWQVVRRVFGPLFAIVHSTHQNKHKETCIRLLKACLQAFKTDENVSNWLIKVVACNTVMVAKVLDLPDTKHVPSMDTTADDALVFWFGVATIIAQSGHVDVVRVCVEWLLGHRGRGHEVLKDALKSVDMSEFWTSVAHLANTTVDEPVLDVLDCIDGLAVLSSHSDTMSFVELVSSNDCINEHDGKLVYSVDEDTMEGEVILFKPTDDEDEDLGFLNTPLPHDWDAAGGQEQTESSSASVRATQLSQLPAYPFAPRDTSENEAESSSLFSGNSWQTPWPVVTTAGGTPQQIPNVHPYVDGSAIQQSWTNTTNPFMWGTK